MNDIKSSEVLFKDAYTKLTAAMQQVKAFEQRRDDEQAGLSVLDGHTVVANKHKQKIIGDYAAGTCSMDAVNEARAAVDACVLAREQAGEILEAMRHQHRRIADVSTNARAELAATRHRYCRSIAAIDEQSLQSDKKLRQKLLDVYAAHSLSGDSIGFDGEKFWNLFLTDIFAEPSDTEMSDAVSRFEKNYIHPVTGADKSTSRVEDAIAHNSLKQNIYRGVRS